ncbi:hypothetical protein Dvina_01505 [Dactylosporangium vinaceum]|uniref:Uncharacterized protein n=1 Tax=Dactylosporangium vinaceum TaxID=53362 RepID=A0ABV5MLK1_9ACTN|nr:hypothetical protein [Dactylosporangium vinaceum]UAB96933.1 hypothetical protein Dvina_01505 [Dactylosporangium vinaceum]
MTVLTVMATWASAIDAEPVCFKEQESIARRAKLSPRSVRNALTELESAGLIKRLGIVGGHATKRGTVRWGLTLLWGDDPLTAPDADKQAAPRADKDDTPAPRADKEAARGADKEAAPRADNSNQSQSDHKGASDDDGSDAHAPDPSADAAGRSPASGTSASAPSSPHEHTETIVEEVARRLGGMPTDQAQRWIDARLAGRDVKNPKAYLRKSLDRLEEEGAKTAAAAVKTQSAPQPVRKAAERRTAAAPAPGPDGWFRCGNDGCSGKYKTTDKRRPDLCAMCRKRCGQCGGKDFMKHGNAVRHYACHADGCLDAYKRRTERPKVGARVRVHVVEPSGNRAPYEFGGIGWRNRAGHIDEVRVAEIQVGDKIRIGSGENQRWVEVTGVEPQ